MATFPNIRERSGSKCDIPLLCNVLREYARMWQDGLQATDSPESVNALSPVVEFHVRSLKSLFGDQTVCSDHPRPAHLIEDVDKG